jgi:hypothetical protein
MERSKKRLRELLAPGRIVLAHLRRQGFVLLAELASDLSQRAAKRALGEQDGDQKPDGYRGESRQRDNRDKKILCHAIESHI